MEYCLLFEMFCHDAVIMLVELMNMASAFVRQWFNFSMAMGKKDL